MIIVTGGAGFIGSNIVKALNDMGRKDILVVDNLKDGTKFMKVRVPPPPNGMANTSCITTTNILKSCCITA